jgi:tetratricopeptide (TPR) repeat protein
LEPAAVEEIKLPRVLNKEILLLAGLSLAACGVFLFTKQMAARAQQLDAKVAGLWYERGVQSMQSGDTAKALEAFRKATSNIGDNEKYQLALADALIAGNHDAEADQLLLRLRESNPGNTGINTRLARLAAKQGLVQEAVHYYQSALYSNWAPAQSDERRKLRIEFIRYLLAHQQRDLAVSELLVLQGRTPNTAAAHIETAKMFIEADDPAHALDEYSEAVQLDGKNVDALNEAGETAFQTGDYAKAEQYLRAALNVDPESTKSSRLLELTEAVQNEDPLAPQISPAERQKRLLAAFAETQSRLDNCLSRTAEEKASAQLKSLKDEAVAMETKFKSPAYPPDSDAVRSGVGLIFKMQQTVSGYCGKPALDDEALLLIGRRHNGERP